MLLETGKLAKLAGGAVVVGLGETQLLVTATAGKIPGGFFRREGRPSETAILTARLVDRPLRPSFPKGLRNEIHIVATILSADMEYQPDVLAINGASAAVQLAGIPFSGPVGAVRLARRGSDWIVNPTYAELEECTFDMVVAGRQNEDGGIDILMVEAEATENAVRLMEDSGAPKPTEEALGLALELSKSHIATACQLQLELVRQAGAQAREYPLFADYGEDVAGAVRGAVEAEVREAITVADKADREARLDELKATAAQAATDQLGEALAGREKEASAAFRSLTKELVRQRVVKEGTRIDGRGPRDIRPLEAEVGILPRAHGSGLFQRGETQVLNITTLGMVRMEQIVDTLDPEDRKRYMHHYNMPPSANGETGRVGSPKRREIGHGLLAERALLPVVPSVEEFPYVLRLVSEVLSSNGSTSMASVCASSMSLMDAGVPIKAPVAGIAMGLVYAEGKYTTLTDILGAEDAFGDMDFKVAGTSDFVTALQLDTKIDGLPADVLARALEQAYEARTQILEVMRTAIAEPRDEVGETAPKIVSFEIPMDKIGEVIGPKGKVINAITTETGADVSVDDDGMVGRVSIGSTDKGAVEEARRQINLILNPPTAEVGQVYQGRVVNITKFGAFVNILPGRDGLLHISKIGGGKRIDKVEDVLDLGDEVEVRVDDVDPSGKVSLSLASAPDARGGGSDGGGSARSGEAPAAVPSDSESVSFEDTFDAELRAELGDLGPARASVSAGGDRGERGDRGGRRRRRR